MSRIVLCTFGSLGDLHPYLAVALGLQARGHQAVLATNGVYRDKILAEGLEFAAIRPDVSDFGEFPELMKHITDRRTGSEYVIRQMMMPWLRASYDDLLAASEGADLLLAHCLTFAVPLVAEQLRLPWMGVALQPVVLWSAFDRSVPMAELKFVRSLAPAAYRAFRSVVRDRMWKWTQPVQALRAELGLPPRTAVPMMEGAYSADGNLSLISPVFAPPQADWPAKTTACGFPIYDAHDRDAGLAADLSAFLAAGEPPIVFTLGSSAVFDAGEFFEQSYRAARTLGRRAVLLTGGAECNRPAESHPSVFVGDYAPYSDLFPHASVIVHQCGIGTTAQGLHAGKPALAMPLGQDQPDNALRLERLGVARILPRHKYSAERAVRELRHLLDDPSYSQRAATLGAQVRAEDGVGTACDAIERVLQAD